MSDNWPAAPQVSARRRAASRMISRPYAVLLVEHRTAAVTMLVGIATSLTLFPDTRGLVGGGLAVVMVAIAAVDARRYIIPDALTLAAFTLGLFNAAVNRSDAIAADVTGAVARGAVFALVFLALRVGYRQFRRRDGLGMGDVKLAGAGGVWVGWMTIPLVIEMAVVAALTFYLARYFVWRRERGSRPMRLNDRLPFGLFFAPAIWLGWVIDARIAQTSLL